MATPPINLEASTPKPPPALAVDVGPDANAAAFREQAAAQLARFEASHEFTAYGARLQAGSWVKPPGFEMFAFVRLIPRNHPNERTRANADRLEFDLKRFGWLDAPNGTIYVGAESDGQYRRWLCCPPEVVAKANALKAAKPKPASPIREVADSFQGQRGVTVTAFDERKVRAR